jgi:hypothetical protein
MGSHKKSYTVAPIIKTIASVQSMLKIHDGFHADEQRQSKIRYGNEALL